MKFKARRIYFPDVFDAPVWVKRLLAPLNEIIDFLIQSMSNGLTFREHIQAQIIDYRFEAPLPETAILKEYGAPVVGVQCVGVIEDGAVNWAASSDFTWRESGNQLLLQGFGSLTAGNTYTARFLVV